MKDTGEESKRRGKKQVRMLERMGWKLRKVCCRDKGTGKVKGEQMC